jgi:hypothetical protein
MSGPPPNGVRLQRPARCRSVRKKNGGKPGDNVQNKTATCKTRKQQTIRRVTEASLVDGCFRVLTFLLEKDIKRVAQSRASEVNVLQPSPGTHTAAPYSVVPSILWMPSTCDNWNQSFHRLSTVSLPRHGTRHSSSSLPIPYFPWPCSSALGLHVPCEERQTSTCDPHMSQPPPLRLPGFRCRIGHAPWPLPACSPPRG